MFFRDKKKILCCLLIQRSYIRLLLTSLCFTPSSNSNKTEVKCKIISFEIIIFIRNFLQKIGEEWITDLSKLRRLEKFVKDKNFKHAFMRSKQVIKKKNDFIVVAQ